MGHSGNIQGTSENIQGSQLAACGWKLQQDAQKLVKHNSAMMRMLGKNLHK
jgi:hypothetical protein